MCTCNKIAEVCNWHTAIKRSGRALGLGRDWHLGSFGPKHARSGRTAQVQFKTLSPYYLYLFIHTCIYTIIMTQNSSIIPHLGADMISLSATMPTEGLRISGTLTMILISPNPMCMHNKQRHICVWEDSLLRPKHYQASRSSHIAGKTPSVSLIVTCKWHFVLEVQEEPPKLSKEQRFQGQESKCFHSHRLLMRYKTNLKSMFQFWCFL